MVWLDYESLSWVGITDALNHLEYVILNNMYSEC